MRRIPCQSLQPMDVRISCNCAWHSDCCILLIFLAFALICNVLLKCTPHPTPPTPPLHLLVHKFEWPAFANFSSPGGARNAYEGSYNRSQVCHMHFQMLILVIIILMILPRSHPHEKWLGLMRVMVRGPSPIFTPWGSRMWSFPPWVVIQVPPALGFIEGGAPIFPDALNLVSICPLQTLRKYTISSHGTTTTCAQKLHKFRLQICNSEPDLCTGSFVQA